MASFDHECERTYCESCKRAVKETYRQLRKLGNDDLSSFHAAVRVLSLRHPDRNRTEHIAAVSEWLAQDEV